MYICTIIFERNLDFVILQPPKGPVCVCVCVGGGGDLLVAELKGLSAEFQVIRGFLQKIPPDLLSYNKIHS